VSPTEQLAIAKIEQEQAVAALWLSEAFRVTCRSKSRAHAGQKVERLPVKEQRVPVKEQSAYHFPMWYMPGLPDGLFSNQKSKFG
jgi:hypothetical protein